MRSKNLPQHKRSSSVKYILWFVSSFMSIHKTWQELDSGHGLRAHEHGYRIVDCFTVSLHSNFQLNFVALWWYYDMETFSSLLALCEGNPPVIDGYSTQNASNVELFVSSLLPWTSCWTNSQVVGDVGCSCDVAVINIFTKISFKHVPEVLIVDKSTMVQAMAWCHQAPSYCLN